MLAARPKATVATSLETILHRVVNREAGADRATRAVDVKLDVPNRIIGGEQQQLRADPIRDVVVDLLPEHDDAFVEQLAENRVVARGVSVVGHDVLSAGRTVGRAHPASTGLGWLRGGFCCAEICGEQTGQSSASSRREATGGDRAPALDRDPDQRLALVAHRLRGTRPSRGARRRCSGSSRPAARAPRAGRAPRRCRRPAPRGRSTRRRARRALTAGSRRSVGDLGPLRIGRDDDPALARRPRR